MEETEYMDEKAAAKYLGIRSVMLLSARKAGTGPVYIKPLPNKNLYKRADLDAWRNTWKTGGSIAAPVE